MRLSPGLLNVNNRLYAHLLFWAAYYFHRIYLYIEHYDTTPVVQLAELPVKIGASYLNLYILLPFWLSRKKYFFYGLALICTVFIATVLQTEIIRGLIATGLYPFNPDFLYHPRKFSATASHIVMIIFITAAIKILKDQYLQQQRNQLMEQQRLHTELSFLKTQISPHFFFNTLNNLYSQVLNKSEKAAETISKLSSLMGYVIYESEKKKVHLDTDLKHLRDYIELEKLRFGKELHLEVKLPSEESQSGWQLPPMLLIPLVENCFKHGRADKKGEFVIRVNGEVKGSALHFSTFNTKQASQKRNDKAGTYFGAGLHNVMRRIELIFGKQANFQMREQTESFSLSIQLPLYKSGPETADEA